MLTTPYSISVDSLSLSLSYSDLYVLVSIQQIKSAKDTHFPVLHVKQKIIRTDIIFFDNNNNIATQTHIHI